MRITTRQPRLPRRNIITEAIGLTAALATTVASAADPNFPTLL